MLGIQIIPYKFTKKLFYQLQVQHQKWPLLKLLKLKSFLATASNLMLLHTFYYYLFPSLSLLSNLILSLSTTFSSQPTATDLKLRQVTTFIKTRPTYSEIAESRNPTWPILTSQEKYREWFVEMERQAQNNQEVSSTKVVGAKIEGHWGRFVWNLFKIYVYSICCI